MVAAAEVVLDPVIIYRSQAPAAASAPTGVFLAGNLCLERDMILSHLTFVDRIPSRGAAWWPGAMRACRWSPASPRAPAAYPRCSPRVTPRPLPLAASAVYRSHL